MSDRPKQEWRIDAKRLGLDSAVYLNDELFHHCIGAYLDVSQTGVTRLTLVLSPRNVTIIADPDLYLVVGERRYRVVEEPSLATATESWMRARQFAATAATRCYCGHEAADHQHLPDGSYAECRQPYTSRFPRCTCGGFAAADPPTDLDEGFFGERRQNGEAHQGL